MAGATGANHLGHGGFNALEISKLGACVLHSTLDYVSPMRFEENWLANQPRPLTNPGKPVHESAMECESRDKVSQGAILWRLSFSQRVLRLMPKTSAVSAILPPCSPTTRARYSRSARAR